jgi:archaellum component FlaC
MDDRTILKFMDTTVETLLSLRDGMTDLKVEMNGLKGEMSGVKSEVTGLKGEMRGVKSEVTGLRHVMSQFREEVTIKLDGITQLLLASESNVTRLDDRVRSVEIRVDKLERREQQ